MSKNKNVCPYIFVSLPFARGASYLGDLEHQNNWKPMIYIFDSFLTGIKLNHDVFLTSMTWQMYVMEPGLNVNLTELHTSATCSATVQYCFQRLKGSSSQQMLLYPGPLPTLHDLYKTPLQPSVTRLRY